MKYDIGIVRELAYPVVCLTLVKADRITCESFKKIITDNGKLSEKSDNPWIQVNLVAQGFCGKLVNRILQHDHNDIIRYIDEHSVFENRQEIENYKDWMTDLYYPIDSFGFTNSGSSYLMYQKMIGLINEGEFPSLSKKLVLKIIYNNWKNYLSLIDMSKAFVIYYSGYNTYFDGLELEIKRVEKLKKQKIAEIENKERIKMIKRTLIDEGKTIGQIEIIDIDIDVEELL